MKPIRLGIVGPGLVFWKRHFPQIHALREHLHITAVLARNRPSRHEFADVWWTTDAEVFFASERCDAVVICSPIHCHLEHLLAAAAAGKWVMVEKPVVGTPSEVAQLQALPAIQQARLFVAENYRYLPSLRRLAWYLEGHRDAPLFVELQMLQSWEGEHPYLGTEWRRAPRHDGGMLLDGGIHLISVLRWLFDRPVVIRHELRRINPNFSEPDTFLGLFRAQPRVQGVLHMSFGLQGDSHDIIRVHAPTVAFRCSKTSLRIFRPEGVEEETFPADADFRAEYEAFLQWIRDATIPPYTLADALADVSYTFTLLSSTPTPEQEQPT